MRPRLIMTFDTPLESSAIFYRTHLDHRDNATDLAIKLVRKGAEIELQSTVDPFLLELSKVAEPWAIGHLLQGMLYSGVSRMGKRR
jgi:hypothetical protein